MGHYCFSCGEKLVGGIVPTTCNCIECFCWMCWKAMFKGSYVEIDEKLFTQDGHEFEQKLFVHKLQKPHCPKCQTAFEETRWTDY